MYFHNIEKFSFTYIYPNSLSLGYTPILPKKVLEFSSLFYMSVRLKNIPSEVDIVNFSYPSANLFSTGISLRHMTEIERFGMLLKIDSLLVMNVLGTQLFDPTRHTIHL